MIITLYYNGLSIDRQFALAYDNGTIFTALYLDGTSRSVELIDRKFYAI